MVHPSVTVIGLISIRCTSIYEIGRNFGVENIEAISICWLTLGTNCSEHTK